MKKPIYMQLGISVLQILAFSFMLKSCVIQNPKPEDCVIVSVKITKVTEGSSSDIVFHDNGSDFYYINRGLEQGLNLDSLNAKVLNKTVTLHLAKVVGGITSEHISQMTLGDEIIYTEFKN
ncbi:hypothetical protein [Winogradskyella ursingii]|uniref:hypothetical protein n=1 Tax=Winogradskyella ursingii TaxID=2686079 RepID=UPI0015CAF2D9|nr:hypothetical protein [Winogradskyella ursingii]